MSNKILRGFPRAIPPLLLPIPVLAHFHTGSAQCLSRPLCPHSSFSSAVSTALPAVQSLIVQQPQHWRDAFRNQGLKDSVIQRTCMAVELNNCVCGR